MLALCIVVLNLPYISTLNTVPHVVLTPNHKVISKLLHNCNFATIINHNNIITDKQISVTNKGSHQDHTLSVTQKFKGGRLPGRTKEEQVNTVGQHVGQLS